MITKPADIPAAQDAKTLFPLPPPRLLPRIVSQTARDDPTKIWGSIPLDRHTAAKGFEDISYRRFSYAVDRAAWWIRKHVEPYRNQEPGPIAYIGVPDARYQILTLGAIKAGFHMLFLSPRNSDEGQYAVVDEANCHKWLCSEEMKDRVQGIVSRRPKTQLNSNINGHVAEDDFLMVIPDLFEWLKDEPVPEFLWEKTVEDVRYETFVVLHTSSTTGLPKVVRMTHGHSFHEDMIRYYPAVDGLDVITRKTFDGFSRLFLAMPLFHAGGVGLGLWKPIYHDVIMVFQPPDILINATSINEILRYGKCTGTVIPPYLVEEMIKVPEYFDALAALDFVQFGSGPLSKHGGDTLLTRQLNCPHFIGSTESGLLPVLELEDPQKEWQYFHFHPWSGVEMRPVVGETMLYELWVNNIGGSIPGMQPTFEVFRDLKEWSMRDLYQQHPEKPYLWRACGRADDVISLNTGEKLNPVDTESLLINAHPAITGALVFGQGKFQPGLLLEVDRVDVMSDDEREELVDAVWPSIEAANKVAPKHGQLTRALILFTEPRKPFLRTPKLSLRRKPTLDLYAQNIDAAYQRLDNDPNLVDRSDLPEEDVDPKSLDSVQDFVGQLISKVTGWRFEPEQGTDLFMLGMDSLHVTRVTRALKAALQKSVPQSILNEVSPRTVYAHPTVTGLALALYRLITSAGPDGQRTSPSEHIAETSVERDQRIQGVIDKWTQNFDFHTGVVNGTSEHMPSPAANGDRRWTFMLTGSTGSLGSHLLETLIRDQRVARVVCLNRASDAAAKWAKTITGRGFPQAVVENWRIQFLQTNNLGAPFLGLEEHEYRQLGESVTHVIHNAWPVNFNMSLESFEQVHVAGIRRFIDFSATSARGAEIMFVSSVGSVALGAALGPVPEQVIRDNSFPSRSGYAESKYVAERILEAATSASTGRVSTTILRVGQIAGPVNAASRLDVWNAREWLPSLLASSKTLGALPSTLGRYERVDWIPVDTLDKILVQLLEFNAQRPRQPEPSVYHLINPAAVTWNEGILPIVKKQLGISRVVSLEEWVQLIASGPGADDVTKPNPAIKVHTFFQGLVSHSVSLEALCQTEVTARASPRLKELGPVRAEWVKKWLNDLSAST